MVVLVAAKKSRASQQELVVVDETPARKTTCHSERRLGGAFVVAAVGEHVEALAHQLDGVFVAAAAEDTPAAVDFVEQAGRECWQEPLVVCFVGASKDAGL